MSEPSSRVDDVERLQQDAVGYFLRAANRDNGLIADSSREGAPCSIAATYLLGASALAAMSLGALLYTVAGQGERKVDGTQPRTSTVQRPEHLST